jgi:hypothetical protein
MNFEAAVLEGDRAKIFRPIGPDFFGRRTMYD